MMKLPIKHKYFMEIKEGKKWIEYRDAHITFIDQTSGEELRKDIFQCSVIKRKYVRYLRDKTNIFTDENVIRFYMRLPKQ